MRERDAGKRALAFALLGTLIVRVVAWAPWGGVTVHAGRVCQTVPTPTPSVRPGAPPTQPSRPTRSPRESPVPTIPTELPSQPSATSQATAATPETIVTTVVATTAPTLTVSPVAEPSGVSPTPAITPATLSVTPVTEPDPMPVGTYPPTAAAQVPSPPSTLDVSSATGSGAGFLSVPCLWNVLGLLLIAGGIVVLVRRRRPR